jgi:hypothetical protein
LFNSDKEIEFYKIEKSGTYAFDILPFIVNIDNHPNPQAEKGYDWYVMPYIVHYNVGPTEESVICPRTFGQPCPICEEHKRMVNAGESKDVTDAIKAKHRSLFNVVPEGESKVLLLDYSSYLFTMSSKKNLLKAVKTMRFLWICLRVF